MLLDRLGLASVLLDLMVEGSLLLDLRDERPSRLLALLRRRPSALLDRDVDVVVVVRSLLLPRDDVLVPVGAAPPVLLLRPASELLPLRPSLLEERRVVLELRSLLLDRGRCAGDAWSVMVVVLFSGNSSL